MKALLALFVRSVRDDMRSRALLWARLTIALMVIFTGFTCAPVRSSGAPGLVFFSTLVWMNFVFICVAAMSYFSSAITEEKEEGTLGLLRMTDLSPFAILLGKGVSRYIGGLLLVLVQVPFAMLAITLGGVRLDQVLMAYGILAAFLFFACNLGLLASVMARSTGVAGTLTLALGGAILTSPLLVGCVGEAIVSGPFVDSEVYQSFVHALCVPITLAQVLRNAPAISVWATLLTMVGFGLLLFVLARGIFDRFSTEASEARAAGTNGRGMRTLWPAPKRDRAWEDAICWRDFHFIHGGGRVIFLKSLVYFAAVAWWGSEIADRSRYGSNFTEIFAMLLSVALPVTLLETLFATSRVFRLEKRDKTFSGLAILPMSIDAIIRSKRRAILMTAGPALCFVGISVLMLMGPFLGSISSEGMFYFLQGLAFFVLQIFLNHYLVAWFSLRMKWGGFPLALGVSFFGTICAVAFAGMLFREALFIPLMAGGIPLAIAIRGAFRRRLEAMAAEE
jgi:ABC-type transport system involved in multi-copper enzyme maturation permease subunit